MFCASSLSPTGLHVELPRLRRAVSFHRLDFLERGARFPPPIRFSPVTNVWGESDDDEPQILHARSRRSNLPAGHIHSGQLFEFLQRMGSYWRERRVDTKIIQEQFPNRGPQITWHSSYKTYVNDPRPDTPNISYSVYRGGDHSRYTCVVYNVIHALLIIRQRERGGGLCDVSERQGADKNVRALLARGARQSPTLERTSLDAGRGNPEIGGGNPRHWGGHRPMLGEALPKLGEAIPDIGEDIARCWARQSRL